MNLKVFKKESRPYSHMTSITGSVGSSRPYFRCIVTQKELTMPSKAGIAFSTGASWLPTYFFNFMRKLMPRCVLHLVLFNSWLFVSEALIKSNADTEIDLEALKRGLNFGKDKASEGKNC